MAQDHQAVPQPYVDRQTLSYSERSPLNIVDIYRTIQTHPEAAKYWIIYIHGGAWRDPLITSRSIEPTLHHLLPTEQALAGVASLSYRLSPYPDHSSHPGSRDDEARNVRHPAHIEDVLTAIDFLQRKYQFGANYLLLGHSCGATLALQAVMGMWRPHAMHGSMDMPSAIVGLEGIYDLQLLRDSHSHVPVYQELIEGAFGPGELEWKAASPVSGKYAETWSTGKAVVIAHSDEDELVEWAQAEAMSDCLWREKKEGRRDVVIKVKGSHDEVWRDGRETARVIGIVLKMLDEDT